ncbi:unnamed protein product [Rhizopus stolonifer]
MNNGEALLECLSVLKESAGQYGAWSGLRIFKKVKEMCGVFDFEVQTSIEKLHSELNISIKRDDLLNRIASELAVATTETPNVELPTSHIQSMSPRDQSKTPEPTSSSSEVVTNQVSVPTAQATQPTPQAPLPTSQVPCSSPNASSFSLAQGHTANYNQHQFSNQSWVQYPVFLQQQNGVPYSVPPSRYNVQASVQQAYHYPSYGQMLQNYETNRILPTLSPNQMPQFSNINQPPPLHYHANGVSTENTQTQNTGTKKNTSNQKKAVLSPRNKANISVQQNVDISSSEEQSSSSTNLSRILLRPPVDETITELKRKSKIGTDPKDLALYSRKTEDRVRPFNLIHGQDVMDKWFEVTKEDLDNLYSQKNKTANEGQPFPLIFMFTAWHTKSERKMCWPDQVRADLNSSRLRLEKRQRNRNGVYSGTDKAYDLKNIIKEGRNTLRIFQDGCACSFKFCIRVYVRESENYICNKAMNTLLDVQAGEDMIDILLGKKVDESQDDEIVIQQPSVKVSLICPILFTKIKMPVKGKKCKHVECFDLYGYLILNKKEFPPWLCPHCNEECTSQDLAHDMFFEKLLQSLPKNTIEVEFREDHSNMVITKEEEEEEGKNQDKQKTAEILQMTRNEVDVIDLISDDEDNDHSGNQKRPRRL